MSEPAAVKQVIVMRTDTNPPMRKGKMIAQGAHASIAFLTRKIQEFEDGRRYPNRYDGDIREFMGLSVDAMQWIRDRFTKICLRVDTEEELLAIYKEASESGLEVHLITDSGQTEFKEPTRTCLAIGPNRAEEIDRITGPNGTHPLKLL